MAEQVIKTRRGFLGVLRSMIPDVGEAFTRFPLPLLCAAALTTLLLLDVEDVIDIARDDRFRLYAALVAGFLWFLASDILAQSRHWSLGPRLVLYIVGLGAIVATQVFAAEIRFDRVLFIWALVLIVGIAPYIRRGPQNAAFWQFNHRLWLGAFLAIIGASLFAGGLWLIIETLEFLFDVTFGRRWIDDIWIIALCFIAPLNWLSLVPNEFGEEVPLGDQGEFTSRAVAVIVKYILVPLLLIYTAILYAYAVRIAADGVLPKGRLSWMVLAYGATGMLTALFAWPTRKSGGALVRFFWRYWFFLLTGPAVLLFLAAYVRIDQYGVTYERYLLILFGAWLGVMAILFGLWRHGRDIRLLPASLALVLLIGSLGTWGARGYSVHSQRTQLATVLEAAGLLKDGRAVRPASKDQELPDAAAFRVRSIIFYLRKNDGLDALQPWFAGVQGDPFEGEKTEIERADAIFAFFKIKNVTGSRPDGLFSFRTNPLGLEDISDFEYMSGPIALASVRSESTFAGQAYKLGDAGQYGLVLHEWQLHIDRDGERLASFDLKEVVDQVRRRLTPGGSTSLRQQVPIELTAEGGGIRARLYILQLFGELAADAEGKTLNGQFILLLDETDR